MMEEQEGGYKLARKRNHQKSSNGSDVVWLLFGKKRKENVNEM